MSGMTSITRYRFVPDRDDPGLRPCSAQEQQRGRTHPERPIKDLLAGFLSDRQAELAVLEAQPWDRPGVHERLGPISIGWTADYALGHTWEHLSQMLRVRLYHAVRKA